MTRHLDHDDSDVDVSEELPQRIEDAMKVTMFSVRKPKRPRPHPLVLLGLAFLLAMSAGMPFQLISLPDGYVYAPAIRVFMPAVAILVEAFVLEHLLRTWSIDLGKILIVSDWGIVGPFRKVSKDVLAEARLHDEPLRVELLDHHGSVLVTLGPWDPESFWGSSRTRKVCERFVQGLNASRTGNGDHARL